MLLFFLTKKQFWSLHFHSLKIFLWYPCLPHLFLIHLLTPSKIFVWAFSQLIGLLSQNLRPRRKSFLSLLLLIIFKFLVKICWWSFSINSNPAQLQGKTVISFKNAGASSSETNLLNLKILEKNWGLTSIYDPWIIWHINITTRIYIHQVWPNDHNQNIW